MAILHALERQVNRAVLFAPHADLGVNGLPLFAALHVSLLSACLLDQLFERPELIRTPAPWQELCYATVYSDRRTGGCRVGGYRGGATERVWPMKILILAMLLGMASPAFANSRGGDLYAACNSPSGTKADTICTAYLNGYMEGVDADQAARQQGTPICIPDSVSTDRMRAAVQKFAKEHPDTLNFGSAEFVAAALMEAFPCKNSN